MGCSETETDSGHTSDYMDIDLYQFFNSFSGFVSFFTPMHCLKSNAYDFWKSVGYSTQQSTSPTHTEPGALIQLPTPQGGDKRNITGHSAASGGTPSTASSGPPCGH